MAIGEVRGHIEGTDLDLHCQSTDPLTSNQITSVYNPLNLECCDPQHWCRDQDYSGEEEQTLKSVLQLCKECSGINFNCSIWNRHSGQWKELYRCYGMPYK